MEKVITTLKFKDIFSNNQTGLFTEDYLTGEDVCQAIASYCKTKTPVVMIAENYATSNAKETVRVFNVLIGEDVLKFHRWSEFGAETKAKYLPRVREAIAKKQADELMKDLWGLFPKLKPEGIEVPEDDEVELDDVKRPFCGEMK